MIGQNDLLNSINTLVLKGGFPRFVLLSGDRGSGRKLVASYIAQQLGGHISLCGISADEIRTMISMVNKTTDILTIIIADADEMSVQAKNALLKITEEPPKNAWFIMTVEDEASVPDTILSRATTLKMNKYTPEELTEFALNKASYLNPEELDIIANICRTPGEVKTLVDLGVIEFWEYVNKVLDNIDKVSTANSFKIAGKVALKPDSEGYEVKLFWRAFMMICTERMTFDLDERVKYSNWIKVTSKCMQSLRTRGVNLQMLFDSWIIDIRGV